jgi:hypothetical protein
MNVSRHSGESSPRCMGHPLLAPIVGLVASALCDQPGLRPLRHEAETHLIVTATAGTRQAGEGERPFVFPDWQPLGSRRPIVGQLVAISHVSGVAAAFVRSAAGRSRHAILVPWDHDPGCQPIPWVGEARWMPIGETGFVAARLRPRARWVDDIPTFDVSDAWREPYSVERMKLLATNMPEVANAIMTPAEYGSFYAALPELSAWQRDPVAAVQPLRAWRDRNRDLAAKYPARWTIETTLRWADSRRP